KHRPDRPEADHALTFTSGHLVGADHAEGQHYRMTGLNLLAAIIIYWNTKHLGHAIKARKREGLDCSPELLAHISSLGWAHILLTGEYRWTR
ncbi:Tn3 family transposase, partial [Tritonibacter scottomollicae]